jgi:hypothetical protein
MDLFMYVCALEYFVSKYVIMCGCMCIRMYACMFAFGFAHYL